MAVDISAVTRELMLRLESKLKPKLKLRDRIDLSRKAFIAFEIVYMKPCSVSPVDLN